jgi:4-amino-4-deoxy-L-arabinose transferase-like glycosyltransferase
MADARVSRTIKYCLGAAIAGRVLFPWLFGLLDNDGAILLAAARQQAADGLWSVNSPLHVWLTSICFRLFSVELWATRLVPMLAGVGAIALVHRQAAADGGEHAGIYAALLLAVTPVAAFYSCADVPYALLTFFGLLGLVLLTNAMSLEQAAPQGDRARTAESAWLGVAAGLAWAGAFACKTFAAVFIVPAIAALWPTVGNVAERRRGAWFPPLLAIASWAGVAAALTAWRWQTLGWSVIYDFQTDFRFDLLTQVFLSERWTDLVSLQAFALPLYAPALALAAARPTVV